MSQKIVVPDDPEKAFRQAMHRLEEQQVRDRVKERKKRTRRLIQEGAILEKAVPGVAQMDLKQLEDALVLAMEEPKKPNAN